MHGVCNKCITPVQCQAGCKLSMKQSAHDPINNPSHYTSSPIECIDAIEATLGPEGFHAYCRGNAIKYIWRAPLKGDWKENIGKAIWYLQRMLKEKT